MNRGILTKLGRWLGRALVLCGFVAGVVVLLLWLAGAFTPKVPGTAAAAEAPRFAGPTARVELRSLPQSESAVGTIRAVHEINIGSKLMAQVTKIALKAGQAVRENDVLVRLDDRDLQARLQQSRAAEAAAEAVYAKAAADEQRDARLKDSRTISTAEYEKTHAAFLSTAADLRRARETVKEVQAMLDWATIRSPIAGTVIDKKVDVGDMVRPGQILLTLYDPKRMQLVAGVRESLAHRLKVGQPIGVRVDALDKVCSGTVSEIVPEAQSASRAFQVKVTGPCPAGIYSGMFGRIIIPLEDEQVLVVPRQAVRNVGQLELVEVIEGGQAFRRAVRTGRTLGKDVEVLSGLRQGEEVALPGDAATREAGHG